MMKLMSLKQYMKMSKPALIRKIMKALKAMPKAELARLCYNITKSKLPRLKKITSRQIGAKIYRHPYKVKRPFTKRQLAAQRLFAKRARAGTLRKGLTAFQKSERKAFQQAARKRKRERYFIGAGGMTGG